MLILFLLSLVGLCISLVLCIISKIGLTLTNANKQSALLKLLNFSYYLLIISLLLFIPLIFIN